MDWDETKETFQDRPDVPADEKLTADEWNNHVTDQKNHAGRHEDGGSDEVDVSGLSGVLADAQTPQTEAVQDIVGALIQANGNITTTYDDANDTLTIDTTALNEEEVEDAVAALVTAGNAITVNYDDANDALSIAVDESALSFYDGTNLTANVDNESVSTVDLRSEAETPRDETINRSLDTWYQNTTSYPLKIMVWRGLAGGGRVELLLAINDSQSVGYVDTDSDSGDGTNTTRVGVQGIVPPNDYYRVEGSDISVWKEQKLGVEQ